MSSTRKRRALTLVELLVALGIVGVLVCLTVPAVQKVRGVAARMACANNVKQIALAVHGYVNVHSRIPPQGTRPRESWTCRILPYLGNDRLLELDDKTLFGTTIAEFLCPADPRPLAQSRFDGRSALSSYQGVAGRSDREPFETGVFAMRHPGNAGEPIFRSIRLREITDGTSNTVMLGERPPGGCGRAEPYDPFWFGSWSGDSFDILNYAIVEDVLFVENQTGVRCRAVNVFSPGDIADDCGVYHFWSPHVGGGGNFAFADGSVRFLGYELGEDVLPKLATRNGGEAVDLE